MEVQAGEATVVVVGVLPVESGALSRRAVQEDFLELAVFGYELCQCEPCERLISIYATGLRENASSCFVD